MKNKLENADKILNIINHFYQNFNLTSQEQKMIDDLIESVIYYREENEKLEKEVNKWKLSDYRREQEVNNYKFEKEQLQKFYNYFAELYGKGLEIANWHQNGDLEPFDNFFDDAENEME